MPAAASSVSESVVAPAPASAAAQGARPGAMPIHIEPYQLPVDTLRALAQMAALEWVHSDAGKVRAAQEAMTAEPRPAHVPREPRRPTVVDEGPLVLVETRKDLAQLRLPFETTP
jgi:ribonuclease E